MVQKSGVHQLRLVVDSCLFHYLQSFVHLRWLGMGFLNHAPKGKDFFDFFFTKVWRWDHQHFLTNRGKSQLSRFFFHQSGPLGWQLPLIPIPGTQKWAMKKGPLVGWVKKHGMKKIIPIYIGILINSTMIRTPIIKQPGFPMESRAPRVVFIFVALWWLTSDRPRKGQPKEARNMPWFFFGDPKDATETKRPASWWQLKYFLFSPPYFGENDPIRRAYSSKWVGSTTNKTPRVLAVFSKKKQTTSKSRTRSLSVPFIPKAFIEIARPVLSSTTCWHQMICSMAPPMTCDQLSFKNFRVFPSGLKR